VSDCAFELVQVFTHLHCLHTRTPISGMPSYILSTPLLNDSAFTDANLLGYSAAAAAANTPGTTA
jgi:hypothetical protein